MAKWEWIKIKGVSRLLKKFPAEKLERNVEMVRMTEEGTHINEIAKWYGISVPRCRQIIEKTKYKIYESSTQNDEYIAERILEIEKDFYSTEKDIINMKKKIYELKQKI